MDGALNALFQTEHHDTRSARMTNDLVFDDSHGGRAIVGRFNRFSVRHAPGERSTVLRDM